MNDEMEINAEALEEKVESLTVMLQKMGEYMSKIEYDINEARKLLVQCEEMK